MNLTSKLTGPALLLALMLPLAASAQMMGPPSGMGQPGGPAGMRQGPESGRHHGMVPGLALSEAQQDKAFALKHGQEPLHRELAKAVHKAREAMRTMVKSGEFDEKSGRTRTAASA